MPELKAMTSGVVRLIKKFADLDNVVADIRQSLCSGELLLFLTEGVGWGWGWGWGCGGEGGRRELGGGGGGRGRGSGR